ncbi:MAG: CPBP family intramembrane metalloprotease [Gemmatimonadetes bacterium]|nr:CPBP family intramembrane metalloprotease [Gemmatimonadota bacterium]
MTTRSLLVVIAAAAAITWLLLDTVHWAARTWTVILLVPLPALFIVQGRKLGELDVLPRSEAYISSIASLWILAALTAGVGWVSGYRLPDLGLIALSPERTLITSVALTAAGIAVLFAFRLAGVREPPLMRELLPVSRDERILFLGVAVTAGICEEIIFRGFLIAVLHAATASLPIAVLVSSAVFGVAHAYQQPAGAVRATILGAILALPLLSDGSIVPAIIAHAAIDIISGLWLARYLLR